MILRLIIFLVILAAMLAALKAIAFYLLIIGGFVLLWWSLAAVSNALEGRTERRNASAANDSVDPKSISGPPNGTA